MLKGWCLQGRKSISLLTISSARYSTMMKTILSVLLLNLSVDTQYQNAFISDIDNQLSIRLPLPLPTAAHIVVVLGLTNIGPTSRCEFPAWVLIRSSTTRTATLR